ncbi:MAG: lipoprotein-releasing ABC transporter permease subunit [Pseudomonadota bacterium]
MIDETASAPFGPFERMLAWRYMRSRRADRGLTLVTVISVISIMLAVGVLIITMSVMNGFRETMVSRILGANGHVFVEVKEKSAEERTRLAALARATQGVTHVTALIEGQVLASANGQATGAIVRGISPKDLADLPIVANNIVSGSLKNFVAGDDGVAPLAVGYRLAAALGADAGGGITLVSPEGASTPFGTAPRSKSYPVGATFNLGMSEYDGALIYMPLADAQLFFDRGERVDRLELRVADPDKTQDVMRALRAKLGSDVYISDWVGANQSLVTALVVERNVMRLILMMVVLIATMNIIAGLIMMVRNKSKDIAILRTMGATRGAILRVFIMSGMTVGAWGALAGLVGGTLFCIYIGPLQDFISWAFHVNVFNAEVYSLSRIPAKVEWPEVGLVAGWALLMSFVASLLPAFLASRLEPVEALRYE